MILTTKDLVEHVAAGFEPYQHALPDNQLSMPTTYFQGFHAGVKAAMQDLTTWAEAQGSSLNDWPNRLGVYLRSGLEGGPTTRDRRVTGYFDGYDVVLRAVARHTGINV